MSYEVTVRLHEQEAPDTRTWYGDLYLVKEELLSPWPLHDDPGLWYDEPSKTDKDGRVKTDEELEEEMSRLVRWDEDPPQFSYLWEEGRKAPIKLLEPHIPTNLFGRTVAECFADFPTDFEDTPPPSPLLSPMSPVFSPSALGEEDSGLIPTYNLPDTSVDEMSQQLWDSIRFDSPPPQSPLPIPISVDEALVPPPLSPSTCDQLSVNSHTDSYSSSSTLSVGTSSNTSSTYALSPSPKPFIASTSNSPPGPSRPLRRLSPLSIEAEKTVDPCNGLTVIIPPPNQIVLEEAPTVDAGRRQSVKRNGSCDDDEDFDSQMDDFDGRPRKKTVARIAPKRHPCTVPGCHESFTRPNDVLRHVKNAAIHKGSAQQAAALAASSTLCKYCGEELSRADAARRHELKSSCGKRTIRRKSTYSMLPA
ncbi:hypothetical protein C8R46DRAFT_26520 [Mycena filopes]|nr:hypothetical protein C8R46DRAFT_26520 [Mycena filopes]